ncbi:NnrS family protein [Rubellimicrobium rubrum]|uniref:NnrS family protein n=1 Tax=Rubellimicrobium rubrum TaxID=2585369 RepID=A0A5C4MMD6_9RHOB|nr:NnrS family protein [Rubellimicrobium rubrum]TNC43201.1 NnrS family protein [Rubellimicrobium rubrum]
MSNRASYSGPALLSMGFRTFFLLSALFALAVVPVWVLAWHGRLTLGGPFIATDWHIHEMIWGYTGAVIAGFLFTAVPNWTGRMPTRGWPLGALAGVWVLGRLAVAGLLGLAPLGVLAVDAAFLLAVAAMILREIVAGRNWRNLMVLGPVLVFLAANVVFHVEAMQTGTSDIGRRLGLAVVVFLITLIGGRIIPSFTRNWLAKQGAARMPVPVNRFDGVCLGAGALSLLAWSCHPGAATGTGLVLAGLLQALRLSRWRGQATWRSPLLVMLHVAYGFVPLGLVATGLAGWNLLPLAAGLHLLGVGAIGGMTLAVMMRATMGHTGRDLVAGPWLTAAFVTLVAATALRAGLPEATILGLSGLTWAAALWTGAFGAFTLQVGPWLLLPQMTRKQPSR